MCAECARAAARCSWTAEEGDLPNLFLVHDDFAATCKPSWTPLRRKVKTMLVVPGPVLTRMSHQLVLKALPIPRRYR